MIDSFPSEALPVAVIGAGPVGLAAAAHLAERQLPFRVFEAGTQIARSVRDWGHVRLFSPWGYNIDKAARRLLERHGWQAPDARQLPTGAQLYDRYLAPLSQVPVIRSRLETGAEVVAISRQGVDKVKTEGRESAPFEITIRHADGVVRRILAAAVIDASGTWQQPNPLGANGMTVPGERELADRIFHGIPDVLGVDRERYAGRRVLVVGAGHSAANVLLSLATLAESNGNIRLAWAVRGRSPRRLFGTGEPDELEARGALGAEVKALFEAGSLELIERFRIVAVEVVEGGVEVVGLVDGTETRIGPFDEIVAATGQRPNLAMTRELRLDLDPWLECSRALGPLIDPNIHSCGTVPPHGYEQLRHPEANYFAVGAKSYGRAPTFLMATGYEQVRSVTAALAGNMAAAAEVDLTLPETGVCGGDAAPAAGGCCGGPAPDGVDACCVKDADAKATGESGCGCGARPAAPPVAPAAPVGACCAA
jgi:hypothetical protein